MMHRPTVLRFAIPHPLERGQHRFARLIGAAAVAVASTVVAARPIPPAEAADVAVEPRAATSIDELDFLRVRREAQSSVGLEVSVHEFVPAPGQKGPRVSLVGAVHIGDRSYYQAVQNLLDAAEVVLYESVKPSGTGGAGGDTDAERVASTRAAMEFVAGLAAMYQQASGEWPINLDALRGFAAGSDPRLPDFLDSATSDAWGNELQYELGDGIGTPRVRSLGADGTRGGTGIDADLVVDVAGADAVTAFSSDEDNLQMQLAEALGLEFQLDAVDYGRPGWVCSDMSIDQLNRALSVRGVDFELFGGTLAGSTLPAKLVTFLLRTIRFADRFMSGAISDTMKIVLVETLGDESVLENSLGQFPGFAEVIIDDRNQIVIDDLEELIASRPDVESVAIFYGAGHLPDLTQRLHEQLGYEPDDVQWLRAIDVDLTKSAVSEREVMMIRNMVRNTLRQMNPDG